MGCVYEKNNTCASFFTGNFWLSSAHNSNYVYVMRGRCLRSYIPSYTYYDGVRPVIMLALNKREKSEVNNLELEISEVVTVPNVEFTVKTDISPNEANNKTLKWSSSDNNVVQVNEAGTIIGKSPGIAKIYVDITDGSNIKKEINITVNEPKKLSEIATTSEELEITEVNSCATTGTCEPGTAFAIKVNDSEIYKFYVISDDGSNVTLIMNQNVGVNTVWKNSKSIDGPVSVFNVLQTQTNNWTNISLRPYALSDEYNTYVNTNFYNMRARILSRAETVILGCQENVADSCPAYLSENGAYWLSTSDGGDMTAQIISSSKINWAYATWQKNGVRPVITIPKK